MMNFSGNLPTPRANLDMKLQECIIIATVMATYAVVMVVVAVLLSVHPTVSSIFVWWFLLLALVSIRFEWLAIRQGLLYRQIISEYDALLEAQRISQSRRKSR